MSREETFVEGVVPVWPIRSSCEREVGQSEKSGNLDFSYEGSSGQYPSRQDHGPRNESPQVEEANPAKCLNPLFKTEMKRLVVFQVLSHDEGVAGNERDPSQIFSAVDVLAPAQVGFKDPIGPFEYEVLESATLVGVDIDVDVVQSIQRLGFESAKRIVLLQVCFSEKPPYQFIHMHHALHIVSGDHSLKENSSQEDTVSALRVLRAIPSFQQLKLPGAPRPVKLRVTLK